MSIFENIAINMNIPNNTSGTQKGTGSINNAKNEILRDMAMKLLDALSSGNPGESLELKAEVRDIMQNQLILTLPDASVISGRTDTLLPLSIGDNATFKVTLNPEQQITLSLLSNDTESSDSTGVSVDNPLVKKALSASNIPINPRSQEVTSELLTAGQSVSTANIRKFITLSLKHPDIPIKEMILLDAHKVPLTSENLTAFKELANGTPVWEEAIAPQSDVPPIINASVPATDIPNANVPATDVPNANVHTSDIPDSNAPAAGTRTLDIPTSNTPVGNVQTTDVSAASITAMAPPAADAPPTSDIHTEAVSPSEIPPAPSFTTTDEQQHLEAPTPIEPKDFSEEAVKKFYGALKKTEIKSKDTITNTASNAPAAKTPFDEQSVRIAKATSETIEKTAQTNVQTASVSDKLQFMQDINNVFPFIQIPVKLQEENAKGELYVFEKKKRYNPDEPLTAVLHLELESLGPTDIKVSLFQNKVSAFFEVADESALNFFRDELPGLTSRLEKLGLAFESDFKVKYPEIQEKPLLYQFLEAHSPKNYSRYTFDVHA